MGKKYYISADGGGTKLLTILFDSDFHLLSVGESGAINQNFEEIGQIRIHMQESINQCLEDFPDIKIEQAWAAMPGPVNIYEEILRQKCNVEKFTVASEGGVCLLAGLATDLGIVALSGTGSDAFYVDEEAKCFIGGCGGLIGDEGSGYDIGRRGITAAIHSYEQRSSKTLLEERICEKFKIERAWDMVNVVHSTSSPRRMIASVCKIVSDCADEGDIASLKILIGAGEELASQVSALIRKNGLSHELPVLAAGGAWKSNAIMYEAFKQSLLGIYPKLSVSRPLFEPVVGAVVGLAMGTDNIFDDMKKERLKKEFGRFVYQQR